MKRIGCSLAFLLFAAQAVKAQAPAQTPVAASQPVYLYLYAKVTDHVNLDISEARLHRLLPMIEKYKNDHPDAHVSATVFFSGAISHAFDQENGKTHIKDYVLDYKKRGVIEIGYDGTDEPTYEHRPVVKPEEQSTPNSRWLARADADEKFLTEARDPLTGAPQPGVSGGLKEMQRVFGEAACITGVSTGELLTSTFRGPETVVGSTPNVKPEVGDWEVVPVLAKYNTKAILFGLPDTNPAHIPGFRSSVMTLGRMMSPEPRTPPELFWADYVLRSSESSGPPSSRALHGYDSLDDIKSYAGKLDRTNIRIVHFELGSERDYYKEDFLKGPLSAPLSYAYAHPDSPKTPADMRLSAEEVNAAFAKEDVVVKWFVGNFLPANAGSRFISNSDLKRMVTPDTGFMISTAALKTGISEMLTTVGNDTFLPSFVRIDGKYLSLAETFQVLTDELAEFHRTGKFPESVQVRKIHGPIDMARGHGPNVGEVSAASIAKMCDQIQARLHDETADPIPRNTVPPGLVVDGVGVNSAQFLRLMAQAMVDPVPDKKLRVRMTYMIPGTATVYPKTRLLEDTGATWTFKPAPLNTSASSTQASR